MRITRHAPTSWLAAVALAAVLAGCAFTTPIKDIVDHPRDYADKKVTVEGEVKDVFGLLVVRYFTLDDGTAQIGVVTERPLPQRGERIRVTGTVREAFALGDRSSVVLVEEAPARAPASKP